MLELFSITTLKITIYCLLTSVVLIEMSYVLSFVWLLLRFFSLSLVFSPFTMMLLVYFSSCLLFVAVFAHLECVSLGKFLGVISSNIFCLTLPLLFFWDSKKSFGTFVPNLLHGHWNKLAQSALIYVNSFWNIIL